MGQGPPVWRQTSLRRFTLQAAGGSQGAQQQSSSATTSSPVSPVVRHIALVAEDAKTQIANNVSYTGWTFNGTVPGPTITGNQGDTIFAKFINNVSTMAHSIDFHAAEIDWSTAYASVAPGQSKAFNFTVNYRALHGTRDLIEGVLAQCKRVTKPSNSESKLINFSSPRFSMCDRVTQSVKLMGLFLIAWNLFHASLNSAGPV
jgi:hypothetical protein